MDEQDDNRPDLAAAFGAPIFFGLWCVAGWWSILRDPFLWADYGLDPGPSVMPVIVLTLLSTGSVLMLARAVYLAFAGTARVSADLFRHLLVPALFTLSIVALVPLMYRIGFIPAALAFCLGWMLVLHDRRRRLGLPRLLAETMLSTAAGVGLVAYAFIQLIHVPLP